MEYGKLLQAMKMEVTLWWDLTGLKQYLSEQMMLRHLHIKIPTSAYSEEFVGEWNSILSAHLSWWNSLLSIRNGVWRKGIWTLKESFSKFVNLFGFKYKVDVDKLEPKIKDTKRSKFLRDVQDYNENSVYE